MLETKELMVAIDFYSIEIHTMDSMATVSCLVTNILQNIFFCVWEKKETHTGLEQHDGVWMMIKFMKVFLG